MFTEPYTNFHELNLDWILQKLKEAGGNWDVLEQQLKDLKEYVDAELLKDTEYLSSEAGWHVIKVKDGYVASIYLISDDEVTEVTRTTSDSATVPAYWTTPVKYTILPVPLTGAAVSGTIESFLGAVSNAVIQNNATLQRVAILFDADAGADADPKHYGTNLIIAGKHAVPEKAPTVGVKPKRMEAIDIADSYYRARTVLGREYAYGANAITYALSDTINNENGAAMMECDTFVALVMMGIPYNKSPYADDTPNLTFDFQDLVENPDSLTWPLSWKYNAILNRKVTYTGGENWYYWNNKMVFKDPSLAASGDIAVFRRDGERFFDGITHTGIVHRKDGKLWLYHVTGDKTVPSPMMFEPLENVVKRGGYTMEENVYFARPDYA